MPMDCCDCCCGLLPGCPSSPGTPMRLLIILLAKFSMAKLFFFCFFFPSDGSRTLRLNVIQRMRPPPPTHSHRESEIAAFAIECYNCAGSGTCANYLAAETVSFCVEGVVAMVITSAGDMFRSLFLVALVFSFFLFLSTVSSFYFHQWYPRASDSRSIHVPTPSTSFRLLSAKMSRCALQNFVSLFYFGW